MQAHTRRDDKIYLDPAESEYLFNLKNINWLQLAPQLGISDVGLIKKRNGQNPFTIRQFVDMCLHIGIRPIDVFNQNEVSLHPTTYGEGPL